MRYRTSHFVSKQAAIRYYSLYGYDETTNTVERKIADGEIHVGVPSLKANQTVYLDADGRYFIEEQ